MNNNNTSNFTSTSSSVFSKDNYSRIFSYPHGSAWKFEQHKGFAGVVCEEDFGNSLGRQAHTPVEAYERNRINRKISRIMKKRMEEKEKKLKIESMLLNQGE